MSAFTDAYDKLHDETVKVALRAAHARLHPDDLHPELRAPDHAASQQTFNGVCNCTAGRNGRCCRDVPADPGVRIVTTDNTNLPLGTFDDDPGGPWQAPGVPCSCAAAGDIGTCHEECANRLDRRPGWKPGVCGIPDCGCTGLEHP